MNAKALLCSAVLVIACSEGSPDPVTDAGSAPDAIQCERPLNPPEGCREAACEAVLCGSPGSYLDANLCERTRCERKEDCLPDEECREVHYAPPACSYFEDPSRCSCGFVLMDFHDWFCMPRQSP